MALRNRLPAAALPRRLSLQPPLPSVTVPDYRRRSRPNWAAISAVVALHGIVLYELVQIGPVRNTLVDVPPLFVSFIAAPALAPVPEPPKPVPEPVKPPLEAPKPELEPVKPKSETPKPRRQPRLISTSKPAPAAMQTPPQATPPQPPVLKQPAAAPPASAPPAVVPPDFAAAYLDNPAPAYPLLSRRLGEAGKVLLRVHVNSQGRAESFELSTSSNYQRLDQAAIEAVRRWRFAPARQGEQAIAAWVLIPINFKLD